MILRGIYSIYDISILFANCCLKQAIRFMERNRNIELPTSMILVHTCLPEAQSANTNSRNMKRQKEEDGKERNRRDRKEK